MSTYPLQGPERDACIGELAAPACIACKVPYHIGVERLEVIKQAQKQRRVPAAAFDVEDVQRLALLLLLLLRLLVRVHAARMLHGRLLFPAHSALVEAPRWCGRQRIPCRKAHTRQMPVQPRSNSKLTILSSQL
jgi:hypothetical protein